MKKIKLYYDGDCPFCKEYSQYVKLKQQFDIELVNARDCRDAILRFKENGFDINDGFIIESLEDGLILQGADAVQKLDKTLEKTTLIDSFISVVVNSIFFKKVIYPVVKVVRVVVLKLIGLNPNIKH